MTGYVQLRRAMGQSVLTAWPGNKSVTLALLYGVSLKILIAFERSRPEAVVIMRLLRISLQSEVMMNILVTPFIVVILEHPLLHFVNLPSAVKSWPVKMQDFTPNTAMIKSL